MADLGAGEMFDENARRFGRIFGEQLKQQITNEEYLLSQGGGDPAALLLMRRALQLRALDAAPTPPTVEAADQAAESEDA